MKCPKCSSKNTKNVSVLDPNWRVGNQRCKDCGYQGDWGLFCNIINGAPWFVDDKGRVFCDGELAIRADGTVGQTGFTIDEMETAFSLRTNWEDKKLYAVMGLIINNGKVLAVSRKGNYSDLGLIGGKIDPGETPEEALVREMQEEVGIKPTKYHPCFEDLDRTEGGKKCPCRTYMIEEWEGNPVSKENAGVEWVLPERLFEETNSFHQYNIRLFNFLNSGE
jgi:8-oxo-dGTP diphosphatase